MPRIVAPPLLAFGILDFALGQPVVSHIISLVGWSIAAGAVVIGYTRRPGVGLFAWPRSAKAPSGI